MELCPFRGEVCWGERCVLWNYDSEKCVVVGLLDALDVISDRRRQKGYDQHKRAQKGDNH